MFRSLTRFCVLGHQLDRSLVQVCSVQFSTRNVQGNQLQVCKEGEKQWQSLLKYFKTSDRHKHFLKDSKVLYQFDDETKNLIRYECVQFGSHQIDWTQTTANLNNSELICAFDSLLNCCQSNEISLSEERFDGFIDDFIKRLPNFSLNELIQVVQSFVRYPLDRHLIRQRNWIELFQALDQACTIQAADLLPEQLLFVSSIWLDIPLAKRTWFTVLASRLLNRHLKGMSAPEIAQALFFINCMSQPLKDIRAFENIFEENIDHLTLEEFASVLWTFIRLETKVEKQELKHKFFNYLEQQDFSRLNDPYLAKILVITSRLAVPAWTKSTKWAKISKNLRATIENRSLKICILLANVGVPVRHFDKEIIKYVFMRCLNHPEELKDLSMPDLEYLSRILSMSKYENQEMLVKVGRHLLDEVEARLENVASRGFYTNFINIVRNLTMIDVYNLELMDNIFRPEYIKFIHKLSKQVDMQMYEIDGYNRINLKGVYKGNLLPSKYLDKMCFLIEWVPNQAKYRKQDEFSYAVENTIRKLFTHCQYAHAVCHRRHADLFVCIDKRTLKPLDISNNFPPLYKGRIIKANSLTNDDPNLMVFAFVAGNTKEYLVDSRNKCENIPIGYLAQKIEQLQLLGFHPISIPIHFWKANDSEKTLLDFVVAEVNAKLTEMGIENQIKVEQNQTAEECSASSL